MRKLFTLLLCIVMVLPLCVACADKDNKNETTTTEEITTVPQEKLFELDLTGYKVVQGEFSAKDVSTAASGLVKAISEKCGVTPQYSDDWLKPGETELTDAKEIVVGITERTASRTALASLEGSCFTVRMDGNRIVLLGTDDDQTIRAVEYFIETYLSGASGSKITIPETLSYTSEPVPVIDFLNTGNYLEIIFKDGLDNEAKSTDEYDRRDYEVAWAVEICDLLNEAAGDRRAILGTDWISPRVDTEPDTYEVLIGYADRSGLETIKSELGFDEYTVRVIGKKVFVFGWNLTTLQLAVNKFKDMLSNQIVKAEDGTVSFSVTSDYKYIGSVNNYLVDFPSYDGGKVSSAYDANNGALGILIEETTKAEFDAYCQKVVSAGYTRHLDSRIGEVESMTFIKDKSMIHTYYTPALSTVRIVTDKEIEVTPNAEPAQVTKLCDPSVTQVRLENVDGQFGMSYILRLEDGSFIVYDGGSGNNSFTRYSDRLYTLLNAQNVRTNGITIAAWIITHPHWDHRMAYQQFMATYGSRVKLEMLVMNSPDEYEMNNSRNYDKNGLTLLPQLAAGIGAKMLVPYTGQCFYIRNAKVEVIYSHEAMFPENLKYFNNCSTVTRLTIAGQTLTFLGDIQNEGCHVIEDMYSSAALKSDIVQVSHHGATGATKAVYDMLKPDVLLWPTHTASYNSQIAGTGSASNLVVDYYISHNLGVTDIFVADITNKTLMLPYTPGSGTVIETKS